jgi:hypothetical protein
VDLFAAQTITRPKVFDRSYDFILESFSVFKIGFFLSKIDEELSDESADGRITLGRLDSGLSVDLIG